MYFLLFDKVRVQPISNFKYNKPCNKTERMLCTRYSRHKMPWPKALGNKAWKNVGFPFLSRMETWIYATTSTLARDSHSWWLHTATNNPKNSEFSRPLVFPNWADTLSSSRILLGKKIARTLFEPGTKLMLCQMTNFLKQLARGSYTSGMKNSAIHEGGQR